jgi:hypothetical protein
LLVKADIILLAIMTRLSLESLSHSLNCMSTGSSLCGVEGWITELTANLHLELILTMHVPSWHVGRQIFHLSCSIFQ